MQNQQPNQQGSQRKIQIKVSDDVLKGAYANAMQVLHTKEEFILDFMNLSPHQSVGIINSRVIMSPGHFKRVILALQDNLKKYESGFGKIEEAEAPSNELGFKAN
ncbi:hypothetical protein COV56_01625 [Candidatus Kuenenbacteria bacterium CG11_big_fil_rev_8_21_14_0_20_37_9]|uniref:DUF3467 domain-containing protein n=1 Tax=Candidatus Kuenenbacteria bacterium CG08_land_8_20_14_0_20_37_23 TaxID=1974617 RepID=A0A2M6XSM0_9BACT|nr:MAG: hypothetical protein COV56_01625 [Candidatus Kuenenbacteria bacterium CG11_big_fil_rev_8_21_14_0_20_37_9]PIU10632.1 MAG: DUF3467 domain-containing protein [Candidatus Kuenenbacteria bacterium CG08_land_8_20_14_0_20_37_23]